MASKILFVFIFVFFSNCLCQRNYNIDFDRGETSFKEYDISIIGTSGQTSYQTATSTSTTINGKDVGTVTGAILIMGSDVGRPGRNEIDGYYYVDSNRKSFNEYEFGCNEDEEDEETGCHINCHRLSIDFTTNSVESEYRVSSSHCTVTLNPTLSPTRYPTEIPTSSPSRNPTESSVSPTQYPTAIPTKVPTRSPSLIPTSNPTYLPTQNPSVIPTTNPTSAPTKPPSNIPTQNPTGVPSSVPTLMPSNTPNNDPTAPPVPYPSRNPSENPTENPTQNPTNHPTFVPTMTPSNEPTNVPSGNPSMVPTYLTSNPSENPSQNPTSNPTFNPTITPSNGPTESTQNPTETPTNNPIKNPTQNPIATQTPSQNPSLVPSTAPTTIAESGSRVSTNGGITENTSVLLGILSAIGIIGCCTCALLIFCCMIYCRSRERKLNNKNMRNLEKVQSNDIIETEIPMNVFETTDNFSSDTQIKSNSAVPSKSKINAFEGVLNEKKEPQNLRFQDLLLKTEGKNPLRPNEGDVVTHGGLNDLSLNVDESDTEELFENYENNENSNLKRTTSNPNPQQNHKHIHLEGDECQGSHEHPYDDLFGNSEDVELVGGDVDYVKTSRRNSRKMTQNYDHYTESKPLKEWTIENVCDYLSVTEYKDVQYVFRQNEIDGEALQLMERDILLKEPFKFSIGRAIKFMNFIQQIKDNFNGEGI